MRALALGGVAGPVLFTLVTALCAAARPDYSHVSQFVSELGATGTPNAAIMNYAGFVPTGILLAAFGIALGARIPRGRSRTAAASLIACFGAGLAIAGLLSCDPGCPHQGASLESRLHDRVSVAAFLAAIGASGLLGLHFRRLPGWRCLWPYSVASSAAALGLLVLLASSLESRNFTGLWQRLLLAVLFAWCAVVGVRSFRAEG